MARTTGSKGTTARKGSSKGKAQAAPAVLQQYANVQLAAAALPAVAKALAGGVGHTAHAPGSTTQGPSYIAYTSKGGTPLYQVTKTGKRSGTGPRGNWQVTLHLAQPGGTFGPALCYVASVGGAWFGNGKAVLAATQ